MLLETECNSGTDKLDFHLGGFFFSCWDFSVVRRIRVDDLPGDFTASAGISGRVQDAPPEAVHNLLTSAVIQEHLLCLVTVLI